MFPFKRIFPPMLYPTYDRGDISKGKPSSPPKKEKPEVTDDPGPD